MAHTEVWRGDPAEARRANGWIGIYVRAQLCQGRAALRLARGGDLSYDRLVVSPGIDFTLDDVQGYAQQMAAGSHHPVTRGHAGQHRHRLRAGRRHRINGNRVGRIEGSRCGWRSTTKHFTSM